METITFIPNRDKTRKSVGGRRLNYEESSIINEISTILKLVLRNTLKFNKLTCADEIYNEIAFFNNNVVNGIEPDKEVDLNSIRILCNALCMNNGVLIKIEKNGKSYFKLNYQEIS